MEHLAELPGGYDKKMMEAIRTVRRELRDEFAPDGFNIGINEGRAGGQTVFHLHCHIIPRYHGDVDQPEGGVRGVIPSRQQYEP